MDHSEKTAWQAADFSLKVATVELPLSVCQSASAILIDTLACMIAGSQTEPARRIAEIMPDSGAAGSPIVGTKKKTDKVNAVYCNAYATDVLEFNDSLQLHPSCASIPAALAFAKSRNLSGREFLSAIIAGYEVGIRVGKAIKPTMAQRQLIPSHATWQGYVSAVTGAVAAGLQAEQLVDAMGYVGSSSPIAVEFYQAGRPLSWIKQNFAEQARAGAFGVMVGIGQIRAARHTLGKAGGFWRMIGSDQFEEKEVTSGLGCEWLINGVAFKPYPCCRMLHTAIDAALTICRDQTIPVCEIARVRVGTSRMVAAHLNDPTPATLIDATFSLQHALAAALLHLPPGPEWFTPQNMSSPAVKSLIDRISVEVDGAADDAFKEIGQYQATVEILSTSGVRSSFTSRESPVLPVGDLGSKFERLVYPVAGAERGAALLNSLSSIIECPNIEPILISIEQLIN